MRVCFELLRFFKHKKSISLLFRKIAIVQSRPSRKYNIVLVSIAYNSILCYNRLACDMGKNCCFHCYTIFAVVGGNSVGGCLYFLLIAYRFKETNKKPERF